MTEPRGAWDWLEQAAQEARDMIDHLYSEGRSGLEDQPRPAEKWPGTADATGTSP